MKKHLYIAGILLALGVLAIFLPACSAKEPPHAPQETVEEVSTPAPGPKIAPATNPEQKEYKPERISFTAEDELEITADLYKTDSQDAPCIILFHMANSSRGEYAEIAPRLCEMGYNCLAVDQRSGWSYGNTKNLTVGRATEQGLPIDFLDALPDLRAALLYAKDALRAEKIIVWGSSYSASLAFVLGSEYPEDVAAIMAFSPVVESFILVGVNIAEQAENVSYPVFITAETGYFSEAAAKTIYESVAAENKVYFRPEGDKGIHGSPVLNENYEHSQLYWEHVANLLNRL